MLRAQNKNGDIAAKNIPKANHGRKINQLNALIMIANDKDNKTFP